MNYEFIFDVIWIHTILIFKNGTLIKIWVKYVFGPYKIWNF